MLYFSYKVFILRCQHSADAFALFFYFPIGFVLAVLRIFIGCHAFLIACVLSKLSSIRFYVLRVMCMVLGVVVKEERETNHDRSVKVIVTNHVSMLDHLAVDLVLPCVLPGVWDLPKKLNWALGIKDFGVKQGRDVLIQNVKRYLRDSDLPVIVHPEGATTNGRKGLLKFSTWPFSLDHPVQPIVIQVNRPLGFKIAVSVIGSRWWSDLFCFLFVPFTLFTLRYLPVMTKHTEEDFEEFTKRVQVSMAKELGIVATNFTCADKVDHAKRILNVSPYIPPAHQTAQPRIPPTSAIPNITDLASQVKEVLPHVPLEVIKKDLATTRCIDTTLTRLLEGTVIFTPESVSSQPPKDSISTPSTSAVCLEGKSRTSDSLFSTPSTAAQTFGTTAEERMQSYQDRKAQLIETARRRYKEKHKMV
ncbi:lipid droplet-regulating VLDL assembly factor AUP1-like isoform X2 [Tachypleus tridentatus]|uniref:lipid droplet-regulating VLDL assembly factor AUP1-like isoform X2 n=1 Tax=Tachypleus tridentatus TaxID=6853 RepID=UPI003FD699B6